MQQIAEQPRKMANIAWLNWQLHNLVDYLLLLLWLRQSQHSHVAANQVVWVFYDICFVVGDGLIESLNSQLFLAHQIVQLANVLIQFSLYFWFYSSILELTERELEDALSIFKTAILDVYIIHVDVETHYLISCLKGLCQFDCLFVHCQGLLILTTLQVLSQEGI